MNREEQILRLIKANNGIITTKEILNNKINKIFLSRLVKKGKIEKVKRGLYVLPTTWGDEYFNLVYGNNAVFSHETALYFLNLCEVVPSTYHISVKRGYNASLKKQKNVKLYFVSDKNFDLGKISILSPQGQNVFCYNAERCICDLLKGKDNQDIETLKYAIKQYLSDKNKRDIPKLIEYSKKIKVEKELNKYLEVLM